MLGSYTGLQRPLQNVLRALDTKNVERSRLSRLWATGERFARPCRGSPLATADTGGCCPSMTSSSRSAVCVRVAIRGGLRRRRYPGPQGRPLLSSYGTVSLSPPTCPRSCLALEPPPIPCFTNGGGVLKSRVRRDHASCSCLSIKLAGDGGWRLSLRAASATLRDLALSSPLQHFQL